jgi:hypothetical protein
VIVAIVIAAAAILGGIIVVAIGKGGEMSVERPELPGHMDFQSATDVADYRPPGALVGYSALATEHALAMIARTIAGRDTEIDWLRRRLAELQPESVPRPEAGTPSDGSPGSPDGSSADEDAPAAEVRWQASSAASSVASWFAASQRLGGLGGLGGEDE